MSLMISAHAEVLEAFRILFQQPARLGLFTRKAG
jgi:hypothetical protein